MKINGKVLDTPAVEIIPLLRGEDTIFLQAKCVTDYSKFEAICPSPEAPFIQRPGQKPVPNFEDPIFVKKLDEHSELRSSYMIIESLSATPELEWETVDMTKPETWKNYLDELRKCFSEIQCTQIISGVMSANGLNSERIDKARKDFLVGTQVLPEEQVSQLDEASPTQSGESAKG